MADFQAFRLARNILPRQMNNTFIILNISPHKPVNLDIFGLFGAFPDFSFCPKSM